MLIFLGREAAGYIGCGGGPVRKAANKFFKPNKCSSGEGRDDSSKVKARLIKASKNVGWSGCTASSVLLMLLLRRLEAFYKLYR